MPAVFFLSSLYYGKLNNNHIDRNNNCLDVIWNATNILDKESGVYNLSIVNLLLRLEGLIVFICCLFFYNYLNGNWILFVVLLFTPDISALGYLINKKTGNIFYNCFHTYVLLFFIFFLISEIFALYYLINKITGTILYNFFHTYVLPLILLIISILIASHIMIMIGLIWTAHIGMDRIFGYGLKYEESFHSTHFNRI